MAPIWYYLFIVLDYTRMKQCPNPNCILYTRLEELPDAYVKCPGCGGGLVDVDPASGALQSAYLPKPPGDSLLRRNLESEFEEAFPDEAVATPSTRLASNAPASAAPQQYDDEYYPYDDTEPDESVAVQPLGISKAARIAYGLALLLLLAACVLFTFVLSTRFLAPKSLTSAQATETAIVALLPAVNTPVPVMPTVPQSNLPPVQPSATVELPPVQPPPTQVPQQPTSTSVQAQPHPQPLTPTVLAPTAVSQQPQQPPQTGATAPPAQSQPTGGVTSAQMVSGIEPGKSPRSVTAYGPNDTFTLPVQAQFGPGGVTTMKTRWYGPDGGLLYEIPRSFSTAGSYSTGFTLKKSTPWSAGNYRVDIYTNGAATPAYSVSFGVAP